MRRFARELEDEGISVTKVNFHAGEVLFFSGKGTVAFRGSREDWPAFVRDLMQKRNIDAIFLFGDCRPLHRIAIEAAHERGARVWIFEEGYLRPDWITLERDGVNGYSRMPRDADFYRNLKLPEPPPPSPVLPSFGLSAWYSTLSALTFTHLNHGFPHYVHHRNLNAWYHTFSWVRSYFRKKIYERRERDLIAHFEGELSNRYFFVPLQVHCDFQFVHSPYEGMSEFVEEVLRTFVDHADPTHSIVFKHHPMDRPFRDYTRDFDEYERRYGLEGRLFYVHDLHLPTLLKHARGTITVNSTVGLASLFHGTPVKVMGTAVYDLPGLTHQGSLAEFLRDSGTPDSELYEAFRRYLLATNQANGNFYRRTPGASGPTGIHWFGSQHEAANAPSSQDEDVKTSGGTNRSARSSTRNWTPLLSCPEMSFPPPEAVHVTEGVVRPFPWCKTKVPARSICTLRVENARLDVETGLVLDEAGEPIRETLPFNRASKLQNHPIRPDAEFPLFEDSDDVLVIHNRDWTGYYHWLLQTSLSAYVLQASRDFENARFVLPEVSAKYREILRLAGCPEDRTIFVPPTSRFRFRRATLIQTTYNDFVVNPAPVVREMAARIAGHFPEEVVTPKKLYVSRQDAGSRRAMVNELVVEDEFRAMGFDIVSLADKSLREQIQLFRGANVIASPHGAGLSNIVFCRPGTRIIELTASVFLNACFLRLGQALDLDYELYLFPCQPPRPGTRHRFKWQAGIEHVRRIAQSKAGAAVLTGS